MMFLIHITDLLVLEMLQYMVNMSVTWLGVVGWFYWYEVAGNEIFGNLCITFYI